MNVGQSQDLTLLEQSLCTLDAVHVLKIYLGAGDILSVDVSPKSESGLWWDWMMSGIVGSWISYPEVHIYGKDIKDNRDLVKVIRSHIQNIRGEVSVFPNLHGPPTIPKKS